MAAPDTQVEPDAAALREEIARLEHRVVQAEERRRALIHIMGDLNSSNQRLGDQRKAMIHIMGDLRETTQEMERREQELREKQEQLVQAGKLATLGELTTGVAHELNNPLNNIGLFIGNALDQMHLDRYDEAAVQAELENAMEQVRKATAIISHLRTFGRPAPVSLDAVDVDEVIERSLSLMQEQLRLRAIEVELDLCAEELIVLGNAIQLEQVFINLLTNARDALAESRGKTICITTSREGDWIKIRFADTGSGIAPEVEQRIFDPFFTTKEVGTGTGLGLSITYSIVKEHGGRIAVEPGRRRGASFLIELPFMTEPPSREPLL
jgi:C4-dicarboxylate-specific signal transduction histidine kinase